MTQNLLTALHGIGILIPGSGVFPRWGNPPIFFLGGEVVVSVQSAPRTFIHFLS